VLDIQVAQVVSSTDVVQTQGISSSLQTYNAWPSRIAKANWAHPFSESRAGFKLHSTITRELGWDILLLRMYTSFILCSPGFAKGYILQL